MRFYPITLGAGLALLIAASVAAQEAPAVPSEATEAPVAEEPQKSSFAEAFSEPATAPSEAVEEPTSSEAVSGPEAAPEDAAEAQPEAAGSRSMPTEEGAAASDEPAPASTEMPAATPEADPAAPVAEAVVPKKGEPPTKEFMVGVWAEEGKSCETALDFKADGTLIGPFPRWMLESGVLTMAGSRQKIMLTVLDKNTMQSRRSETDPPRKLKRC